MALVSMLSVTLIAIVLGIGFWLFQLNQDIVDRLQGRRFLPPVEFLAAPEKFFRNQKLVDRQLESTLLRLGFRQKPEGQNLGPREFQELNLENCKSYIQSGYRDLANRCIGFRLSQAHGNETDSVEPKMVVVVSTINNQILDIRLFDDTSGKESTSSDAESLDDEGSLETITLEPELFAQFYGDKPILRQVVQLSDSPPACLNAILAIEDAQFLDHRGVSVTGLVRAFLKNLISGRLRQGGSTITQQLVKNYFLTSERTLSRKIKELAMAVILEHHATKDDILETYINEIYMGQNGPFEVRGFGSASEHYFNRPLAELSLGECALLAAIVNSPGRFNPFTRPQDSKDRRNRVLDRMEELKLITSSQSQAAKQNPLPKEPLRALTEPAPFFVEAVRKELSRMNIGLQDGARIFTTLNLRAQEAARASVQRGIEGLEKTNKKLKDLAAQGKRLEGALIAADPISGEVQAIIGGRQYKVSQFNRALQSKRQVGSLMKPIIYLTALEREDADGKPYSPITLVSDEPFTHKYEGQTWTPRNYDRKHYGMVPFYFALKNSLNAATARLALDVGLEHVIDNARKLGIQSPLKALPSLALGAFEMTPLEILQVYSTFATLGTQAPLHYIKSVESLSGEVIFETETRAQELFSPPAVASLVGMMKQTMISGTGRFSRTLGFTHPAAGKTGTTNDTKDAWFAGFTPLHTAVVWVGYDDGTNTGLTGTSGAVPIWSDYMNQVGVQYPPVDFSWPEGVVVGDLDVSTQEGLGVPVDPKLPLEPIELIFVSGTQPSMLVISSPDGKSDTN